MKQLYFDRRQCDDFNISYYEEGSLSLPADVILRSKMNGYDAAHTSFLTQLGNSIVHLRKKTSDAPGWYEVVSEAR